MHQLHPNHATKEFHHLSILNQSSLQSLRILNIDGLDVAVQTLGSTLLVVTLSRDADTESVWNALDTCLPDLLVQLGIETNIGGALYFLSAPASICQIPSSSPNIARSSMGPAGCFLPLTWWRMP